MRSHLGHRKDANHNLIEERFKQNYCSTFDTSPLGDDFPDFIAAYGGFTVLIEVKTLTGKLEPGQERFIRDWRGPVRVVVTIEEADQVCEWMRRQAMRLGP